MGWIIMIQSSNYADIKKRIELKDFIIKGKNNFNLIWFNSYYRLCYVEGILTREEYLIERSLNISFFNNLSRFLTLDRSRMINFSVTRGYREYPKCKKSWRRGKKEIWYIINIWTTCPVFLEKHIRLEFDSKRRFLAHCVFPSTPQKPPVQFKYRFRCNFTLGTIMARQLWDVTQCSPIQGTPICDLTWYKIFYRGPYSDRGKK